MIYDSLCECNANIRIDRISDESFRVFGRRIQLEEPTKIMAAVAPLLPTEDSVHVNFHQASVPALEALPEIKKLAYMIYGGMEVTAYLRTGSNEAFESLEYHQGSETVIAIEDCVLFLGMRQELSEEDTFNVQQAHAFYLAKGEAVELYSTTMHSKPCCVTGRYVTAGLILKGTNEVLDKALRKHTLAKCNKWILVHPTSMHGIEVKDYPGLRGRMIRIQPVLPEAE